MRLKNRPFLRISTIVMLGFLVACNFSKKEDEKSGVVEQKDTYARGELALQHGMELFNQHCVSCHNFASDEIGPNLSGVTSEIDKEWLSTFIKDPKTVIDGGDDRAVALFEKYKTYMPSFQTLKEKEMEDLLAFIHRFSEAEKKNINTRSGALLDPIVDKIPVSNLRLVLEEWMTIPPSAESPPLARINKMDAVITSSGERLFIADLRGKLYEILNDTVQVYLDLSQEEENFIDNPGWGTGFGSFTFHPEFETNGLLYTTHTEPPKTEPADFALPDSVKVTLQWVITEWKSRQSDSQTFSGKKRELLRVDMVTAAHGFQELTFNPLANKGDNEYGHLYLGIGDGASALRGHPYLCENASTIWGSIIRIDPSGNNSNNGKYGIPPNNPFVGDDKKLNEIWCSGFRNPHRISWNPLNSDQMFVTNIGQHSLEEVNLVKKGADYGWPNREGTFLFDVNANTEVVYPLPDNDSGYSYPVVQYDHDEGNAISGGFVYSGDQIPVLRNKYIFGDVPRATLFFSEADKMIDGQQAPIFRMSLELNGKETNFVEITKNERVELRLGIDSSGELYLFTKSDGKVYKVVGCREVSEKMNL